MFKRLKSKLREALEIAWMVITKTPEQILEENRQLRRELREIENEIGLSTLSSMSPDELKGFKKGLEGLAGRFREEEIVQKLGEKAFNEALEQAQRDGRAPSHIMEGEKN